MEQNVDGELELVEERSSLNDENMLPGSSDEGPLNNFISPTKKKRKRSTPEKAANDSQDGEGATCLVCLDNFNSGGEHRMVSLKCGHLFGDACIRRWFKESQPRSCPQCKTKAAVRDIRLIYASKIRIYDNSREIELQNQLLAFQDANNKLVMENSLNSMAIITHKSEIRRLKEEIGKLKTSAQHSAGLASAGIRTIKRGRMYMEKNLDFKENLESKLIRFMGRCKKLIVAQKSVSSSIFAGYGVKFIDVSSYRQEKFINTNSKALNDFCVDSNESCVVTASKEVTCKTYNMSSNQVVYSFTPSTVAIWTCSYDDERPHNLLLGGQNGITYIYDTRMPGDVLKTLENPAYRSPVKYTITMKRTETFPLGGFFNVHMRGLIFYEHLPTGEIASTTLNFNDPIITMTYDDRTEMLLITRGPTGSGATFKQTRIILMKLVKEENIPVLNEIFSFNGSNSTLPAITHPTQIKVPDGCIVASYQQDSKMLQARTPSVGLLQELSVNDAITDICPVYLEHTQFFAALSHSRCRLFKISLDY